MMGISVWTLKHTMPEDEFRGWMQYFRERPADIQEMQMAMLMATVSGFAGNKKVKIQDFIISGRKDPQKPKIPVMSDQAIRSAFGGIAKKL